MARNFRLIHSGMAQMLREHMMERAVKPAAERVAARARATAPVDTGAYQASIHVEVTQTGRLVARVVASDRKAGLIEARTGNLARAMSAARG